MELESDSLDVNKMLKWIVHEYAVLVFLKTFLKVISMYCTPKVQGASVYRALGSGICTSISGVRDCSAQPNEHGRLLGVV